MNMKVAFTRGKWTGWLLLAVMLTMLIVGAVILGISYQNLTFIATPHSTDDTQEINIKDGGLFSDWPCTSPCVYGIHIGETHREQVIPILQENGIAPCDVEPNISWTLVYCGGGRLNVQVDNRTNLVNSIWYSPNKTIRLGKVIEKYGQPDFVSLDRLGPRGAPIAEVYLYWDSIPMTARVTRIDNATSYVFDEKTRVEDIGFTNQELYQDSSEVEFGSFYLPWEGYGKYQP